MISIKLAQQFLGIITVLIAYLTAISLAGYVRAWVAGKVGDDTPAALGFLTLNPLAHIDFLGMVLLFIFRVGWGRHIPINSLNITAPRRSLKIIAAHFSDCAVHFALALGSLVALLFMFGKNVVSVAQPMVLAGVVSHKFFAEFFPQSGPAAIALALVLVALLYLNIFLAALSFIINVVTVVAELALGESIREWKHGELAVVIAPIILLYLFMHRLWMFVWSLLVSIITLLYGA